MSETRYSEAELDQLKKFPPALKGLWLLPGWTVGVESSSSEGEWYRLYDSKNQFVAFSTLDGRWIACDTIPITLRRPRDPDNIVYYILAEDPCAPTFISPTGLEDVPAEELHARETDATKWLEAIELERRGEKSKMYQLGY
jgi:hypothetical protein